MLSSLFTLGLLLGTAFGALCSLAVFLIADWLGDYRAYKLERRPGFIEDTR